MRHHPLRWIALAVVENDAINSDDVRPVLFRNLQPARSSKRRKVKGDCPGRAKIVAMDPRHHDSMSPRADIQIVGSTVIVSFRQGCVDGAVQVKELACAGSTTGMMTFAARS